MSIQAQAASPPPPSPIMCQFGLAFTTSTSRRRLSNGGGLFPLNLGEGKSPVNDFLLNTLADTAASLIMILSAVIVLHFLLALLWKFWVNRKFYDKKIKSSNFTPFPGFLAFPNFELVVVLSFLTGVMKSTFVVFGVAASDFQFSATLWSVAAVMSFLLFAFFALQFREILIYRRKYAKLTWKPGPSTNETDDYVMRLLARLCVVSPGPRKRGGYEALA